MGEWGAARSLIERKLVEKGLRRGWAGGGIPVHFRSLKRNEMRYYAIWREGAGVLATSAALISIYVNSELRISVLTFGNYLEQCTAEQIYGENEKRMPPIQFHRRERERSAGNTRVVTRRR